MPVAQNRFIQTRIGEKVLATHHAVGADVAQLLHKGDKSDRRDQKNRLRVSNTGNVKKAPSKRQKGLNSGAWAMADKSTN
jgi:hypothetical protein